MALVVKDRVRETSTTTGTGTLTLAGAVTGFQTFSSAIGNTNTTYYTITNGAEFEVGLGTVAAGTLARTTVLASSNAGSAVSFSAGTKDVFCTYPAGKSIYTDASNNAIALGTPASATLTNATGLPISTGISGLGTNVATFLATPSSANLASAITDETGSGSLVFATSPTFTTSIDGSATFSALSSSTALTLGYTGTGASSTHNVGTAALTGAFTKTINIGTNGTTGSTTNINIGSATNTSSTVNGNVGIGVTPAASAGTLQVGTASYSDTGIIASFASTVAGHNQIILQNKDSGASSSTNFNVSNNSGTSTTNYGEFGMNSSAFTGTGAFNQAGYTYLASASTDLAIGTYGSNAIHFVVNSGATDAMYISSAGNVGIGTASPTYKLNVTTASDGVQIFSTNGTIQQAVAYSLSGVSYTGTITNHPSAFLTNNTERMRIDSAGNVGIGNTPSGTYKLQVTGLISDSKGDVRAAPINSKTAAYVLVAADAGQTISITTGGVTVNASVLSAGDMVSIFNNSGSSQTITQGTSVTLRLSGTATTGSRTLAQYGVATLLCVVGGATPTFACTGAGLT